jgi:hypothetical protein
MKATLQPRLQSFCKHGNHRIFHSSITQACAFDFLSLTPLDRQAGCVSIGVFRKAPRSFGDQRNRDHKAHSQ